MSVALHLYQQLRDAPDDDSRAKAIADAFEQFEERYPNLKDLATQGNLRETELRLQKEIREVQKETKEVEAKLQKDIQGVQKEIKEVEARLQKDIQGVQKEIKEVEARLQKDIKDVELKIKEVELKLKEVEVRLQRDIKDVEIRLTQTIHRQTYWIIGSVGTIIGFIRLLDWFLSSLPK